MRPIVSSEVPQVTLAIFTATRWEYQAVLKALAVEQTTTMAGVRCAIGRRGKAHVSVFQSGIGPQKAYDISRSVLSDASWDVVVSSGFAGALVPCSIGAIVVGHEVMMDAASVFPHSPGQTPIVCDDRFRSHALRLARSIDSGSQFGHIVSLSRIVGTGAEKKIVADRTHAVALDMESASLGYVAQTQHIPFMVVRTISDLSDEDLPIDFNLFLHPGDWMKGVGEIIRKPTSVLHILQLRKHMVAASRSLTQFFQIFLEEVGQRYDSQRRTSTS
ncbi:5'-methylthioadenosine/S-adenosylhomocysteine nucleosidase family protein [Nitrospira sp. M1]